MKSDYHIAVLAGDGIGPEVMDVALAVLEKIAVDSKSNFIFEKALVGGAAIDASGTPLPADTLAICDKADAILFGSVGGPKWEHLAPDLQPERGALLPLRKRYQLFANLRPMLCQAELANASPIKSDIIGDGFDILCVRELTGGIYFGEPKKEGVKNGVPFAIDTMIYHKNEVERVARLAFEAAQNRNKKVTSIDKANVLKNGLLWRKCVTQTAEDFPDVELEHLYVDNAVMQLMRRPRDFDVLLAPNLFGDILSDQLAMIAGSLGMLPSASLGEKNESGQFGLYEPSGGSAPDIAGKNIANPCAQVLSAALMLRFSFGLEDEALRIEAAVKKTIRDNCRTADISSTKEKAISLSKMREAILERL